MSLCEFCKIPGDERTAIWQIVMGSEQCDRIMEYGVCEEHKVNVTAAAELIEDSCDPPHRIDEMIVQRTDGMGAAETIYVDHPDLTPRNLMGLFDKQHRLRDNTQSFPCGNCQTVFTSMTSLIKHMKAEQQMENEKQNIDVDWVRKYIQKTYGDKEIYPKWDIRHMPEGKGK